MAWIDTKCLSKRNGTIATIVRKEVRKRGFFGWVFLLIFLALNALMLMWLAAYWSALGEELNSTDGARAAGTAIGGTIGTGVLLAVWVLGSIITGLLALLTRERKSIITETTVG